ncbi:MAG: amino acid adenylation domain-containing protein, partial [bacterium]|nr:amino acid adenylation domain-containing protein [bacterium]
ARRPFDLARGPVLRAALLRHAAGEHHLLLTVHHIAFDGWSRGVFLRELAAVYQAGCAGRAVPDLPELAVQYADFAVWQREWLAGEVLAAQLAYWRQQLDAPPVLELAGDRPRPAVLSSRGSVELFTVPAELHGRLRELSRSHGATLFMSLMAAFQTLLRRYTGQRDLAVGTVIANRNRAETEALLGFFVNTLVLRVDLSGESSGPAFPQLLARVRDAALGAYAHQDLPFEKLVEELEPERNLSRNPLVQVLLVLQNAPVAIRELDPGLTVELAGVATEQVSFDLTMSLAEQGDRLRGAVWYSSDLFDAATIRRLAGHFRTLLAGIVAEPEARLTELPLLTQAESHELLREWSGAVVPDPTTCIHEDLAAQAARRPDAVAVVFPEGRLSYAELDARADRLAAHLRALGVGAPASRSEIVVGLLLERSPEAVVGMLAILKAGGAYLPLDPAYPAERLAFMLDDAGAAMLLTREELAPLVPSTQSTIVRIEAPSGGALVCPGPHKTENLAYVIYTSGSTGKPKGVMIPHRGLSRLAAAQIRYYGLGPESRVLQFSSLSFDASVYEIFSTLLAGGTLCLAGADELMPGPELSAFLRRHAVNTWTLVPSALAAMPEQELPALATVTVAGEPCPPELVARWAPGRSFVNAYGPTEVTVCASAGAVAAAHEKPPIGRAFASSRLYVVDRDLAPLPIGVPGELLIGGGGLARGYHGRARRTAASFLPDPWSAEQ